MQQTQSALSHSGLPSQGLSGAGFPGIGRRVRFTVAIAAVALGVTAAAFASKPAAPDRIVSSPDVLPAAASYETAAALLAARSEGLSEIAASLPAPSGASANDEDRRRNAAAMLRRAAFALNSARERACQSGLPAAQACVPAYAPAWLAEPARFAPPGDELERRAQQLAGEVAGFSRVVCRAEAARGSPACVS